jgi:hypothetical protein
MPYKRGAGGSNPPAPTGLCRSAASLNLANSVWRLRTARRNSLCPVPGNRARGDPGLSSPVLGAGRQAGGVNGDGLARPPCLRRTVSDHSRSGPAMNAATTKQPGTIVLIRGLWVTSLGFERWVKRFESPGWDRHRPASTQSATPHKPKETDRQNHRQQPMSDSHLADPRRKPRRRADTANGVRTSARSPPKTARKSTTRTEARARSSRSHTPWSCTARTTRSFPSMTRPGNRPGSSRARRRSTIRARRTASPRPIRTSSTPTCWPLRRPPG